MIIEGHVARVTVQHVSLWLKDGAQILKLIKSKATDGESIARQCFRLMRVRIEELFPESRLRHGAFN